MDDAPRLPRARNRQRIAMIVMAVVGVGSVILAIDNAAGHRWVSMAANLLVVLGMALSLFAQRRLTKRHAGHSHQG